MQRPYDFAQNILSANDDSSSQAVQLPFGVNFYGATFESLWVNNNGNVTFDGPLSTYTPFGLAGTSSKIIAPFFADVDTRGAGSQPVSYGWGNTTYEGHSAFCVNWVNVGYFAGHTDKLNSFQLLLVNREDSNPGDFDIIFNYDKIQWESGDFSGGVGGLGGTSAAAGFSNGSGDEGTFYQIVGSLINGSFLDSSPTGLSKTTTDSTVQGRHVFKVRGGNAPLTRYVALGDSFQSGEGAYDYLEGTDGLNNMCHRSRNAYPMRLVSDGPVALDLDFGACSGALTTDLSVEAALVTPPFDDGISQYNRLDTSTKLVTIGIGGNDLQFGPILRDCIKQAIGDFFNIFAESSCEKDLGARLQENYDNMLSTNALGNTYKEIRKRAPFARVVVLGYPRFFVEGGKGDPTSGYCGGVRMADQRWINSKIRELNDLIRNQAGSLGMQLVDIYATPEGHELCSGTSEPFLNNVVNLGDPESFHPTAFAHGLISGNVSAELKNPDPGTIFSVLPGQTISTTFQSSGEPISLSTQWPGSDVVMSLTSPSGRVIDRGTVAADVQHEVGPTFESYHLATSEAGTWTVRLFGAQVAPQGEPARLSVWHVSAANQRPLASFTLSQDGRTVTVDAGQSTDPDGAIVDYLWEFGDGTTATGPTATHTYEKAGRYLTTLAIRDDAGGEDFEAADHVVTVSAYNFSGFLRPVAPAPQVSEVKAGRAVPMKFGLGGDFGLNVITPGSPTSFHVECPANVVASPIEPTSTPGAGSLSYDASTGTYNYVWKTETSWAGTCRTFDMTLDDGSSHQATFRFVP